MIVSWQNKTTGERYTGETTSTDYEEWLFRLMYVDGWQMCAKHARVLQRVIRTLERKLGIKH